ncbi:hypothetical protein AB0F17_08505 [Nonomuraea sp. NPDC026600]|uniref:hypothetical protein n=1 Tax=Nonomuraea sp. NPDC026600 TaxID=3155363 RepID=UPI0033DC940C
MPDLPEEAVQAAVKAVNAKEWKADAPWSIHNIHNFDSDCAVCREDLPAVLTVALRAAVDALACAGLVVVSAEEHRELLGLIEEFADPSPCEFDHDGGCQAHGPTSTWPGCPHARAGELLAALPERTADA